MRAISGRHVFLLAVGILAIGCGSATLKPDGGTGGSTADAGADHSTGTGGMGGEAGTTGTGGAGGIGGGSGTGGTTGTAGTSGTGGALPTCTSTTATSPAMTASDYCVLLLNGCSRTLGATLPYGNMTECTTGYSALTESVKMCRSYHLCNAVGAGGQLTPHCSHAIGMMGMCAN